MKQMYAIIVTGGKRYRVEQGDIVYISWTLVSEVILVRFSLLARRVLSS